MIEIGIGIIIGLAVALIIWKLMPKNETKDEVQSDQLKNAEINLARREAELIAANEAKTNLEKQIKEKKEQIDKLYETVDNVGAYKEQTEKAINKHDEAINRHTTWWDKLTSNVQYQGKFNQEILENVLTDANLVKDRDFIVQKKQTTYDVAENTDRDVTPDVVLKFPERNYVVDAKVSLTNWTDFILEKDEKLKKEHLKKHIASIRKHLFDPKSGLIRKNYNKLYGLKSLQSVIVFFPSDNLYSYTLNEDKKLLNDAIKSNFILTSPRELTNLIKIFEQIKSEKKQIENISKIITSASKIFDKYSDVKTAIKGALQSYRTHANQLQTIVTKSWGSQGLEKQINKLKDDHGVIPGKPIPEIPPEQSTTVDVSDPEEDKDKLN
jgi:DNA recombination protein RmuC